MAPLSQRRSSFSDRGSADTHILRRGVLSYGEHGEKTSVSKGGVSGGPADISSRENNLNLKQACVGDLIPEKESPL